MAEQKVKLTQLPEATDTTDTAVLLVNQNETDQRLPVTHFLRSKNNLSELENTAQARANLGVPSVEDVNDKIEYLIDGKSTFLNGATLESERDFIWDDNSKNWYYWTGAFSKEVPAASTPESTGGIGTGKWVSVSDAALRSQLAGAGGAGMIGTNSGINVQENLDNLEHDIELNTNKIELISNTINNRILGGAKCERKSSTSGLYYHVVKIPKGVGNISKEYGSDPIFVSGVTHVAKISPSAYSKISPAGAISNGDGWREWVIDGNGNYQPWGLQIANGVVYQDFTPLPDDNNHGVQALLLQKDGSMIPAELSDGKTAQQYVDEGAIASFGFHWILVKNGATYQSDADPDIRPRTVFGV